MKVTKTDKSVAIVIGVVVALVLFGQWMGLSIDEIFSVMG